MRSSNLTNYTNPLQTPTVISANQLKKEVTLTLSLQTPTKEPYTNNNCYLSLNYIHILIFYQYTLLKSQSSFIPFLCNQALVIKYICGNKVRISFVVKQITRVTVL